MNKLLTAGLFCLALVGPALAAPGDSPRRRIEFYDNGGTLHEMDNFSDPAKLAMLMAHAKKVAPGTIVMSVDGQLFILQDFKTPSGTMMSDELMH